MVCTSVHVCWLFIIVFVWDTDFNMIVQTESLPDVLLQSHTYDIHRD